MEKKIEILQKEINSLKQKIKNLENNQKIQNIGKEKELNILSDMPKAALKPSFPSKQYNLSSD